MGKLSSQIAALFGLSTLCIVSATLVLSENQNA